MARIYVIDPLKELPDLSGLGFELHVQKYRAGDTFDDFWQRCREAMAGADICVATCSVNGPGQFQLGWMVGRGKELILVGDIRSYVAHRLRYLGATVVSSSEIAPLLVKISGQRK
jgi:hypothetical protein